MSLVPSTGDKYKLRDGSSFDLTNARPEFDPRKVQRRNQYSQNIDPLDLLPNDRDQRGIFRKCGTRAFAFSKGFSHRADRYCVWFWPQRADLSVLEGRPVVRTASQLLDRVGRLDQQSRISGRLSTLRQTCVAAVSGMPQRTIRTASAVREFLRPKQLSLRHHLRKVSRSGPRARVFSRFKDCRKLWNARSDRESCVTSAIGKSIFVLSVMRVPASLSLLPYPLHRERCWRITCTFRTDQTLLLTFMATRPNCWLGAAVFRAAP